MDTLCLRFSIQNPFDSKLIRYIPPWHRSLVSSSASRFTRLKLQDYNVKNEGNAIGVSGGSRRFSLSKFIRRIELDLVIQAGDLWKSFRYRSATVRYVTQFVWHEQIF